MSKGLVHLYYGNGKGKTTCGMGLCVRAAGAGKNVLIHQFLKDNSANERKILEKLDNVTFVDGQDKVKFTFALNEEEFQELCVFSKNKLEEIERLVVEKDIDLLFMDEALHLFYKDVVKEDVLIDFLERRPEKLEVVVTGYNPSERMIEYANYVSHISKEKHPYDNGTPSREGIEF